MPQDFVDHLFGCRAPDIGAGARAKTTRNRLSQLNFTFRQRMLERLRIGIARNKLAAHQIGADHVVDGVTTGTANTDHSDAGLQIAEFLGDTKIEGHTGLLGAKRAHF